MDGSLSAEHVEGIEQLTELLDDRLAVILTADKRAGILTHKIIQKVHTLSHHLYP